MTTILSFIQFVGLLLLFNVPGFRISEDSGQYYSRNEKCPQEIKEIEWTREDWLTFELLILYSNKYKLSSLPLADIEIAVAEFFLTTPYVGKTLENGTKEELVINLREMDCTTFVENVLSLSLCIRDNKLDPENFSNFLTKLRYRGGKIDTYPSRLHYFTNWLSDNEKKGLVNIVSNEFAKDIFDPAVHWMSTHPQYYPQLKNKDFVQDIANQEKEISKLHLSYIPEQKVNELAHFIQNGDILALTTNIDGLDIAHVGLAYFIKKKLHLFHASSKQEQVVISENTLQNYLERDKNKNGIIVARLN